jgi:DNA repair exonuclease SbcCD ATPase subunit
MATPNAKAQCFNCKKETRTFNCDGCSKNFCRICLPEHLQELDIGLEQLENDHDQFRGRLDNQKKNLNECSPIKEIDQWEKESINKIIQTAKECREIVINRTNNKYFIEIEKKLNDIAKELEEFRRKHQFNEIDLKHLTQKLNKLKEEFTNLSNIKIQQDSSALVQKISIVIGKFVIKILINMIIM